MTTLDKEKFCVHLIDISILFWNSNSRCM